MFLLSSITVADIYPLLILLFVWKTFAFVFLQRFGSTLSLSAKNWLHTMRGIWTTRNWEIFWYVWNTSLLHGNEQFDLETIMERWHYVYDKKQGESQNSVRIFTVPFPSCFFALQWASFWSKTARAPNLEMYIFQLLKALVLSIIVRSPYWNTNFSFVH